MNVLQRFGRYCWPWDLTVGRRDVHRQDKGALVVVMALMVHLKTQQLYFPSFFPDFIWGLMHLLAYGRPDSFR